ncbi:MAG: indolepyruvate ferredoxin oxidoreductase subunit alpha [Clostridia bacterium]|nr:indolepyruvate ferredoxin oxidoreductase subunit alpha [Clostridia bacterium]
MKQLMLGNAAIARGLYEAGCRFISSYPGTPSTEITEEAAQYAEMYSEWAPNEKVAMEAAIGASMAGARSFCAMKHVGLNVAADPLFTVGYTGVNGGMVIAVADDPGMHSSQNEQDSRHYAEASKIPMLEPSDSGECLEFTKLAYELSEEFDTPVIIRTCTRVAHSQSIVELSDRVEVPLKEYAKNIGKYVMSPGNAIGRHVVVEERTKKLIEYAEKSGINRIEKGNSTGIICAGTCYQYIKEVFPEASVLKLGMAWPMPTQLIKDFAASVEKLYIIEELDPVIENHVRALGIVPDGGKNLTGMLGELSQAKIMKAMGLEANATVSVNETLPGRPPVMCAGCPHRGLFTVLNKLKLTVTGDIGCYTLGSMMPLFAMDSTVCMGASIGMAHGFTKVRPEMASKTVAVIGDSTFMHSGLTGVVNVAYNLGSAKIIIVDNSITGMTGHQQNPTTGLTLKNEPTKPISLEDSCKALGIESIRVVDPYDMKATEKVLREELNKEGPSVIISRRPCALLKYVKHAPALKVDPDKCKSCKACMKLGCPAIVFDGKARIDINQCVGCGVCAQACAFGAIEGGK